MSSLASTTNANAVASRRHQHHDIDAVDASRLVPPRPQILPPTSNSTLLPTTDGISYSVDSALLSALRDPRERVQLLRLEQLLVELVQQQDLPYWDMGGPGHATVIRPGEDVSVMYNNNNTTTRIPTSFQRCCLHRLADRFGLTREPTGVPGWIRLHRVPQHTAVPDQLLINLDPSVYQTSPAAERSAACFEPNSNNNNNNKKSWRRKILIKRSSSSSLEPQQRSRSISSSQGSQRQRRSSGSRERNHSDKEKAYAEARARIFNDQQQQDNNDVGSGTTTTTTEATASGQGGGANTVTPQPSTTPPPALPQNPPEAASKVTWRNRKQEVNDPDFRRSHPPAVVHYYPYVTAAPPSSSSSMMMTYGSSTTTTTTPVVTTTSPLPATSSLAPPFVPGSYAMQSSCLSSRDGGTLPTRSATTPSSGGSSKSEEGLSS